MLKVFGHLSPDTDTVGSAIAYSWLLNQQGQEATPYVLGNLNKETAYVLQALSLSAPQLLASLSEGDEIVLVDTNNPAELPDGLELASVREIVDHHKLSGLATAEPIKVTIKPIACTATLIFQKATAAGVAVPAQMAGLMLACILSDTLKFTSPTTTDEDKEAAQQLAALSGLSMDDLAAGMFAAKSDLSGMKPGDILLADSKAFNMGDKKVRISTLETTDPRQALAMEADLLQGIASQKQEEGLDGMFFFVVDIVRSASTLLLASEFEAQAAAKAFGAQPNGSRMELPGVVSRKKQMIPPLEQALS